jgi:hypothetical protein
MMNVDENECFACIKVGKFNVFKADIHKLKKNQSIHPSVEEIIWMMDFLLLIAALWAYSSPPNNQFNWGD